VLTVIQLDSVIKILCRRSVDKISVYSYIDVLLCM